SRGPLHPPSFPTRRSSDLKVTALAGELTGLGVRAEVLPADLSDPEQRASLPDRVAELDLTVDILVNNAGLSTLGRVSAADPANRSEEHTSELQSRENLVCR